MKYEYKVVEASGEYYENAMKNFAKTMTMEGFYGWKVITSTIQHGISEYTEIVLYRCIMEREIKE